MPRTTQLVIPIFISMVHICFFAKSICHQTCTTAIDFVSMLLLVQTKFPRKLAIFGVGGKVCNPHPHLRLNNALGKTHVAAKYVPEKH